MFTWRLEGDASARSHADQEEFRRLQAGGEIADVGGRALQVKLRKRVLLDPVEPNGISVWAREWCRCSVMVSAIV